MVLGSKGICTSPKFDMVHLKIATFFQRKIESEANLQIVGTYRCANWKVLVSQKTDYEIYDFNTSPR